MKSKIIIWLPLVVLTSFVILCRSESLSQVPKQVAVKIAEVGSDDTAGEYAGAVLDELAGKMQQAPAFHAVLIAYGPEGKGSGSGKYLLDRATDYLTMKMGKADRIESVYGGFGKSLTDTGLELWLVPPDTANPKPVKNKIDLDNLSGLVTSHRALEGPEVDGPSGPTAGEVQLAAFAQVLHHQPSSVGYIVAYEGDAPGAWRRAAQYDVQRLTERGIPADRLKIINGGISSDGNNDFWVLPKGERLPIKEAAPEHLSDQAQLIREYFEYQLDDSEDQDLAFRGFADLLKDYPDAKICYMIMPSFPDDEEADKASDDPDMYVPTKVDFHAIVEKWRAKFISELKINPNRIIILSPTGVDKIFYGKMHAWIVPANAVLPSPPKVDDDEPPDDDDPPPGQALTPAGT